MLNSKSRPSSFLRFFFLLIWVVALPLNAARAIEDQDEDDEDEQKNAIGASIEQELLNSNIVMSKWFDSMADNLDIFLAGRRLTTRRQESGVKIENSTYYSELEAGVKNQTSINASLRLPNVEQYWQVKFTDYDETKEKGVKSTIVRSGPRPKNYGASIGAFQQLGNVRTAFQPRIALQDPLSIAHSLTFESTAELKSCRVVPRVEFYATPDSGVGTYQEVNFYFKLSKVWSFTLINDGNYEERKNQYSVSNGFSFGQVVSKTSGLSYSMIFSSNNRPAYHLENYTIAVVWGHLLYKKILDYSLAPRLDFTKDSGFRGTRGINLNVGLNF